MFGVVIRSWPWQILWLVSFYSTHGDYLEIYKDRNSSIYSFSYHDVTEKVSMSKVKGFEILLFSSFVDIAIPDSLKIGSVWNYQDMIVTVEPATQEKLVELDDDELVKIVINRSKYLFKEGKSFRRPISGELSILYYSKKSACVPLKRMPTFSLKQIRHLLKEEVMNRPRPTRDLLIS